MGQRQRDISEIECDFCNVIVDAKDATICVDCNINLCDECAKTGLDKELRCNDCNETHKASYEEQEEGKDALENDQGPIL